MASLASPARTRRGAARLAVAVSLTAACTFSSHVWVRSHSLLKPLGTVEGFVNSYNVEDKLRAGFVPEVLEFFSASGGRSVESSRGARLLGQALLESGDIPAARVHLQRAFGQEGRFTERGESAWLLSQAEYWADRFAESARWAATARQEGHGVPVGWIRFLAGAPGPLYEGVPPGSRLSVAMAYGRPSLPRVAVRVNGNAPIDVVVDSGASVSLLSESAARALGVEPVPEAVASAIGLHQVEIPMRFGYARTLELGGLVLRNVPFGILEDEALAFETAVAGAFRLPGVLGVHLMKEFDWRIEYRERRLRAVRLGEERRGSKGQNLFFRRLKPMVRASFQQQPWFLFLLDTGSEPSMVTRSGLRRSWRTGIETTYPMTLEGIGKSRVSWGKISDVYIGVDRYMVGFKDLVVKEDASAIEDGVVGNSFLDQFEVEMRFSSMVVSLSRPLERLLREPEAQAPKDPFLVNR